MRCPYLAAAAIVLTLLPAPARAQGAEFNFCAGNQAEPKNTVVLLENATSPLRMYSLRDELIGCGWPPAKVQMRPIPLPAPFIEDCTEDIVENWVEPEIDEAVATNGGGRVDVVAYSEQAMTLRYLLSVAGGETKVRRLVLWGSPNNGSDKLSGPPVPVCYIEELREGSEFIDCLNGDSPGAPGCDNPHTTATPFAITEGAPPASGVLWVNIWSEEDLLIDPPQAILHDGGINIEVPLVPHGVYPDDNYVLRTTIAALTGDIIESGKPDPGGLCGALPGRASGSPWTAALALLAPAAFFARRARRG